MGKHPKYARAPQDLKAPRIDARNTNPGDERPSWVFAIMDMDGPWSWANIDATKMLEIRTFLASLESMTWNHLLHNNRAHSIARWKISREAQKRLSELRQEDTDDLISLRKTGRERIWGIKDRDVLKLLWWDPDHTVYPTEKQNT